MTAPPDCDVLIVGAGISGLGMAAHLKRRCPEKSFAILERRQAIGGTWDLFRYPGVRSDSDMFSLGYSFAPWRDEKSIAEGSAIRAYLERVVEEEALAPHIRLGCHVLAADWDGAEALWTLTVAAPDGARQQMRARFLILGSGYYDYDEPHDPPFAGREDFRGQVVHPQFWPEDLDYAGKQVVVIGSGATAATLVPALAEQAAHVTMLQRTPSWYFAQPAVDRTANLLRRLLPERLAYALTRRKNIRFQDFSFRKARQNPAGVGGYLKKRVRQELGDAYDRKAFSPPYGPWEQRLCLVPDGDLFRAIRERKASIVTGNIARFEAEGIRLASGRQLAADVIVTATGLKLAVAGKIAVSVDGVPVQWNETFYYRNCLFAGVPNLAGVFGYL
ncbi:MAG TPA: NAD(P)/FAD-dependent oxidoreductase, partial [Woeseiaceae bacterium]|nr:NAD(P)/FAD-dependent oxidoreductase [Woeseiaceae bacterium]